MERGRAETENCVDALAKSQKKLAEENLEQMVNIEVQNIPCIYNLNQSQTKAIVYQYLKTPYSSAKSCNKEMLKLLFDKNDIFI